jgi:OOP family OmpA-OmpF porin
VVSYRLDGLYHFDPIHEVVPYLGAGLGGITFDPDWKGRDTDPLVNYGGGLEYFLGDNIALRADLRHAISLFAAEHNLAFAVGASLFLRPPVAAPAAPAPPTDSDRDGVADAIDQCPGTPVDVAVGPNGCPEDGDQDGVYDYLDRCPDTPPRMAVDTHGCPPQRDSDGDSVVDGRDRCPATPAGAPVDTAGCPKDSDGDGVTDDLDRCPDSLAGARVDERGCWVLRGVQFDLGKATIRPESFPVLDEVVPVLRRNPGLRVEVQGHSDSTGSTPFNERLSGMRARAVMAYLVSKGVAPGRLTAKGFGALRPAASNDTVEGRAKNRRVELKPLP